MPVENLIRELIDLDHSAEITLFRLSNFNLKAPSEFFAFTNCTSVVFNGVSYIPLPCEIEGVEYRSEGALPRPKLRVADPDQLVTGLIYLHGGLEGATITIDRTLKRFLDTQTTADPTAKKPIDRYFISHRTKEIPGEEVEFELCSVIDFVNELLPGRACITKCPWEYRSAECGYTGPFYTLDGKRTTLEKRDRCGKGISDCALRFGRNAVLPSGAFAGLARI